MKIAGTLAAALLLVLVGCGAESEPTKREPTPSASTEPGYIENATCREGAPETVDDIAAALDSATPMQFEARLRAVDVAGVTSCSDRVKEPVNRAIRQLHSALTARKWDMAGEGQYLDRARKALTAAEAAMNATA